MANYYGNIDLTELGKVVRVHPELIREVQMKDGTAHKFLNIDFYEKEQADQYGNAATLKVSCKKENRKEGVKYYIANLKLSQYGGGQLQQAVAQQQQPPATEQRTDDDLPF